MHGASDPVSPVTCVALQAFPMVDCALSSTCASAVKNELRQRHRDAPNEMIALHHGCCAILAQTLRKPRESFAPCARIALALKRCVRRHAQIALLDTALRRHGISKWMMENNKCF